MPQNAVLTADEAHALTAFFFWTAWATAAERPGRHDQLYQQLAARAAGRQHARPARSSCGPSSPSSCCSPASAALVWYYAREFDVWRRDIEPLEGFATTDLFGGATITPSMRATAKYFFVVTAMFFAQVLLGIVTAHYAVEGQGLYGLPMAEYFPYAVTRTWHTQLAVLWIATAWLATGLYVAPLLGGREPKFQRFGVNFLFVSLLVIVVGSFAGEWAGDQPPHAGRDVQFLVRPPGL